MGTAAGPAPPSGSGLPLRPRLRPRPGRPRAAGGRTPVWFMRQAGRSLPEYRALRAGTAMLRGLPGPGPGHRDHPAAGPPARRRRGHPVLRHRAAAGGRPGSTSRSSPASARSSPNPVRSVADVDALPPLEPDRLDVPAAPASAGWSPSSGATPLIGFAGAPFTLATYLIEGGPSKEHARTKALHVRRARGLAAAAASGWRSAPRPSCGCRSTPARSAVQLFDSWAGVLSAADYAERVLPHSRAVFDGARPPATCRRSTSASAPASCCR